MNKFSRKGFTLIELLVVVLIIGVLSSMGVPYYFKTIETSKATNALTIGHLIGNANRMWNLDKTLDTNPNNDYVSGQITDSCNTAKCLDSSDKCNLVACNYVAKQPWDQNNTSAYRYYACNPKTGAGGGCCKTGMVSCVKRRSGKYINWGYRFTDSGGCEELSSDTPDCPSI